VLTRDAASSPFLAALFKSADDAIIGISLEGTISFWNAAAERLYGYAAEEAVGQHISLVVPPDGRGELAHVLERLARGEQVAHYDASRVRKDGTPLRVALDISPVRDARDEVIGAAAIAHDVTAEEAHAAELQQARRQLALVFETASDVLFLLAVEPQEQYRFVTVNPAFLTTTGLQAEQVVGKRVDEVLPPASQALVIANYQEAIHDNKTVRWEEVSEYPSGKIYGEVAVTPVYGESGACTHLVGTVHDVTGIRRAQQALQESTDELTRFFSLDLDLLCIADTDGRFRRVNRAWEKVFGYAVEELDGSLFLDLVHPDDLQSTLAAIAELSQGEEVTGFVNRYRCKDGSYRWIEWRSTPFGEKLIYAAARDITERRRLEEILRASEQGYRTIFEQIPDGVIVFDKDLKTLDCNEQMAVIAGRSREELLGKRPEQTGAPQETIAALEQALRGETATWQAIQAVPETGRRLYLSGVAAPLRGADGEILTGICVVTDLTERMRAEELVEHLAFSDLLTDLPNRSLLRDRLRQAIADAERTRHEVAVIVFNLDRFKLVNDSLGHSYGDRLLQAVATKLSRVLRKGDTLARTGGDEFTLLMPNVRSVRDALALTEKILALCREAWQIDGQGVHTTVSLGVALYPQDANEAEALFDRAVSAMRRAKDLGGDGRQFYDATMNLQATARLVMEHELRIALDEEQFVVYFQPQVDLRSNEIVGAEALVRWQHPERGLVPPLEFIPLAEETGLIDSMGKWIVRRACRQAVASQAHSARPLRLAVNISARRLHSRELLPAIRAALEATGLPPEQLEVEITETAIMVNEQDSTDTLNALRGLGVTIALDDFGTGFSSLSHLHRLPIDRVKIDRSFVSRIEQDQDAAAIVAAITNLAHALGLRVVAEGVETEAELSFLQHIGCDEAQGYLFARPLPAEEYEVALTTGALFPASSGRDS
jgi:diguanylate cyclase (GGDEF)-like protein/PAS domain S-box-containing protein